MKAFIAARQFFALREELAKYADDESPRTTFYRGIVANRFNKLENSVELMQKNLKSKDRVHEREAYETLADSYTRIYEYGKAADAYKMLIEKFKNKVDKKKSDDYQNSLGMFEALRNVPLDFRSMRILFK